MAISRRQFIKYSGAGAGVVAASGLVTNAWGLTPDVVPDPQTDGDKVVPSFCGMCFWKCGILAHVKGDRITKIVGNPAHPLSQGRLCPRGTGGTGLAHDPDRLTTPLMRRERGGQQSFEPVSWDAALSHVAEKLTGIKDKYGPEALALFSHGFGGSWFKTLAKAYGTGNIGAPGYAQCRGSRETAFELTYGSPVGSPEPTDIENTRVLTLIGSHLGENMHNTQVQELARAIDRGADLIVVDPRFSTAASKARWWLPIKPGTDIALLLAWMNVIVEEGLYARDYLEQYAIGFDQLKAHLKDKTPEWAWVHTNIEPHIIRETARFMAGGAPRSIVHPGRRTSWYGDDTQRGRAIAILNALLGSWGRKGGIFIPTKYSLKAPSGHKPAGHSAKPKAPADMPRGTVYPFAGEVLAHGLRDASIPGTSSYDIKAWMVYGTNLIQALPNPGRTHEALKNLDFMVSIDVLPVEITGWADVVLPEASYLERYGELHMPGWKRGYAALRRPVIPPRGDSKPGWWIAKELANRMGLGEHFDFPDIQTYLNRKLAPSGKSLADFEETGVLLKDPEPVTIEEGLEPTFETPSGKIELYSQQLSDAGLAPMPEFVAPDEEPGMFRLLFGRAPVHTFGRSTNNRVLGEIMSENALWVNARVAEEMGLKAGEEVRLVNQDGVRSEGTIKVQPTQRIRPDCVYMAHGFGHTAKGLHFAKGRGVNDTGLLSRVKIDPVMGGTGMNVNFVRIERGIA